MSQDKTKLWYFENFDLMKTLPTRELMRLNSSTKMTEASKKCIIYFPDESSNSVYLIKQGKVKISRISEEGKEIIIAILGPGEIFGESAITEKGLKRDEFAEATEDTILCNMFSELIQELMENDPSFGFRITKIIGFRLKRIQSRFESLIFKQSDERVKSFIKDLVIDEGQKNSNGEIELKLNLTHQDIGKLTATSRQTVTTVLNNLEKMNLITYGRSKIVVKDLSKF
ncbi:Crp/Fnr family transcriptional regulator [Daejeonella sp.]|uniref:Crp/Fnr family transcriptional regulator n=1 Tax=Daejeonella sp. TaxID=2805397 RepID=UPI0025C433CA|nr:Crp/Fnr family transcriptional regulator [Daejeonella sp.]